MEIQSISVVAAPTQSEPNPKSYTWAWRQGDDPATLKRGIATLIDSLTRLETAAAVACSSSRPLETGE